MFPIGDENRGIRLRPYVNWGIIALNILVFLYQLTLSDFDLTRFIFDWGVVPRRCLPRRSSLHIGDMHVSARRLVAYRRQYALPVGLRRQHRRHDGSYQYPIFYLLCGIAAGGLQVLINSNSHTPLIGASGAISGVLAAYLVLYPKGKIRTILLIGIPFIVLVPAWGMIGYWI